MKVKNLVEISKTLDQDLEIGSLHDNGVTYTDEVGVYEGDFKNSMGSKMIYKREHRQFVIIGNPGDFDELAYHDVYKPIKTFILDNKKQEFYEEEN
jgi:hypothetical protein